MKIKYYKQLNIFDLKFKDGREGVLKFPVKFYWYKKTLFRESMNNKRMKQVLINFFWFQLLLDLKNNFNNNS